MLKKVGAIAVGMAAVGLLQPRTARAANGDPLIVGQATAGSGQTALVGSRFSASFGGASAAITGFGTALGMEAVATNSGGVGILATGNSGGNGVEGVCNGASALSYGVEGRSDNGLGGRFAGGRAAVSLGVGTGAVANPNVTGPGGGSDGDLYRGSTSTSLWYRTTGTDPYRKLADQSTAGATHILPTPIRYVDTRNGTGGATGPFGAGEARPYDFDALQPGTIPAKARGIFGNITAASPSGNGNLQTNTVNSFPAGSAAVMSFRTGVNLSNHFVSALDANGIMFVRANISSTHVVIDIQGYWI